MEPINIQEAIHRKMHHIQNPSKMFISDSELRAVWEEYHLSAIFPAQRWTYEQWQQVRKEYLKVLSILIWINWMPLAENFRSIFFMQPGRSDANLPFTMEKLSFLAGSALTFFQFQFAFLPVVIQDKEEMYVHNLEPIERLPFIQEARDIGSGGFGDVTKVVIAPRCLLSKGLENPEAKAVACKSYRTDRSKDDFQKEVNNLNFLKEGLIQGGKRIMLHICAIVQGDNFMILLPLAELRDLDVFLRGGYIALDDTRDQRKVYDFSEEFPGMVPPNPLLHVALFNQLFEVASALVWLHEDLRILGSLDRYCAHMDLKPGNILITRDEKSQVGRWVISDFGISLFDKSTNRKALKVNSIRDVGPRLTSRAHQDEVIRGRGPYEPPEVSNKDVNGRKCDVWSFGCVLSDVLEFALGGTPSVDEFHSHRFCKDHLQNADDYFYQLKPSVKTIPRIRNESNTQVKKEVLDWFDTRSSPSSSPWVRDCIGLLKKMIVIDPVARASARDTMEGINGLMATHFRNGAILSQDVPGTAKTPPSRTPPPQVEIHLHSVPEVSLIEDQNSVPTIPEEGIIATVVVPPASDQSSTIAIAGLDPQECITLPSYGKAVDVAVSASGEHVALLYVGSARIYQIEKGVIAKPEIRLPSTTTWTRLCITAHYLAVYGIKKKTGDKEILMHDLRNTKREIMIPTSYEGRQVTQVHVSQREVVASLYGNCVLLTHLLLDSSEKLRLADDDTINQAAFGASGQWFLVWATGASSDCCYFWDVSIQPAVLHGTGRYHKDSAASTVFSIWPYTSVPACVLRESHGDTFVAQAFLSEPSLPRARQAIGLPDLLAACVLQDHSLLCVSKGKWIFSDREIHQLPLVQKGDDRRLVVSTSSGLGTAKTSVSQTARLVLVSTAGVLTVLICTRKGKVFKYQGR